MPRSQRYTAQQMIDAAERANGLISVMAKMLRCDPKTVRNYRKRYPSVDAAISEKKEEMIDLLENEFVAMVRDREHPGHTAAVLFGLKTLGKERGYTERHEHTGVRGEAIDFTFRFEGDHLSPNGHNE